MPRQAWNGRDRRSLRPHPRRIIEPWVPMGADDGDVGAGTQPLSPSGPKEMERLQSNRDKTHRFT
jgi:hypothetical protein